ncbi:MAG: hypothetical protein RBG13Loki_1252 [Promethearchaeota archaeon CR_4]|nr:MAG: hypothetical protein RBG13Loki_1252 [Candidatus Lokiarchaeota archaeon CR_4]
MTSTKIIINCRACGLRVYYELSEQEQKIIKKSAVYWPCPVIVKHRDHFLVIHLDENFQNRGTETSKVLLLHEAEDLEKLVEDKKPPK